MLYLRGGDFLDDCDALPLGRGGGYDGDKGAALSEVLRDALLPHLDGDKGGSDDDYDETTPTTPSSSINSDV